MAGLECPLIALALSGDVLSGGLVLCVGCTACGAQFVEGATQGNGSWSSVSHHSKAM
jgi:hypothetical protein